MGKKKIKRALSDYTGSEAIELWADIYEPVSTILADEDVKKHTTGKGISVNDAAKVMLKKYPKEVFEILNRVDEKETNGANVYSKVVTLIIELISGEKVSTFFKSAEPGKSEEEFSGSATENTGDGEI